MLPKHGQQEVDARLVATALAFFDQELLRRYVDIVAEELQSYPLYEEMKKEVISHLKGYSRWSVSILVSNSGNHPLSFSPTASLYVNTRGTNHACPVATQPHQM
jgi:hypothetical protein